MITIVVAYSAGNRVIGRDGKLPWHIPEDLANFKEMTLNQVVIMGRKTWQSLPEKYKPLPNRINIIVTKFPSENTKDVFYEASVEDGIDLAKRLYADKEIFLIGGAQLYKYAIDHNLADRIIASEIHEEYEGDTFFPELPNQGMELVKSHALIKKFRDFDLVEYVLR